MRQPIKGRSCEAFTAQHLGPVLKRQVSGHDQAHAFVSGADHVEQPFRAKFTRWNITQLTYN